MSGMTLFAHWLAFDDTARLSENRLHPELNQTWFVCARHLGLPDGLSGHRAQRGQRHHRRSASLGDELETAPRGLRRQCSQ